MVGFDVWYINVGLDMKIGDLIFAPHCGDQSKKGLNWDCCCLFCKNKSSRIGIVIEHQHNGSEIVAMFDIGEVCIRHDELNYFESFNESR